MQTINQARNQVKKNEKILEKEQQKLSNSRSFSPSGRYPQESKKAIQNSINEAKIKITESEENVLAVKVALRRRKINSLPK
ncbi:hypothetical protein [Hymenobacter baengnokdamensis]|uniref:hypothetical protein n=1 Tax=Hymenobacter baengnokdamensis TaxID=2615203 RepID=UPI00124558D9|nr:hypothetical protein [Hymenobacter baengnokdamensis]